MTTRRDDTSRHAPALGHAEGRSVVRSIVVAAAALLVAAPASAQFSVRPVIVQLSAVEAGDVAVVHVTNEGERTLEFRIHAADFDQRESGDHRFLEPGTHERSCSDALSVFPDRVTLGPGERQDVRLTMTLEPGSRTCWSLVFVETRSGASSGIRVGQRIGVKVYGAAADAVPEGEITRVEVGAAGDSANVRVDFRNTGDAPLRPEGELEIRTFRGEVLERIGIEPFSVLPGHLRRVAVPFAADLPSGRYLAVPILDFGADYLAGGQAVLRVP